MQRARELFLFVDYPAHLVPSWKRHHKGESEMNGTFRRIGIAFLGSTALVLAFNAGLATVIGREIPAAFWTVLTAIIAALAALIPPESK